MVMGAIYRTQIWAVGLLALIAASVLGFLTAFDGVTQADLAAAAAETTTVAEPAMELWVLVPMAVVAVPLAFVISSIRGVQDNDEEVAE